MENKVTSGRRPFLESGYIVDGITESGNVLPYDKCRFFVDYDKPCFDDAFGAAVLKRAEEYLDTPIPIITLSMFREMKLSQKRGPFEGPHNMRRWMLNYLCLAEAYENKGRFIEKIADVIWAILDECSWVAPAHQGRSPEAPDSNVPHPFKDDQVPALELFSAKTCSVLALAEYCHRDKLDAISPVICERIDYLINIRGIKPFIYNNYRWTGEMTDGGSVNNWITNITSNILMAAAVTVKDFAIRKRVMEVAMHRLDTYVANQPEDGFCEEGPGYWGGAGGSLFDCLELIEDMSGGKINVYSCPIIRSIGEYIAKFHIDGLYYLNFADAYPRLKYDGKMIIRYGAKCGSDELYSFGKMLAATYDPNTPIYAHSCYRALKDLLTPVPTEYETVKGHRSVWYDSKKVAIFRESENKSEGLFVATKGGHNRESHNHNDVGCLVVYYNGKPVIVDPSHGSYDNGFFGPTRYDRWFMKSSYHSIPTVDGVEERAESYYASSEEVCDAERQCVTMEIGGAFPKEAGIISMKRTVHLDGSVVRVTDDVRADHKAEICFNFLTLDEPKVISDGKLGLAEGRVFEFDSESLDLELERVVNTYLPYDDLNFERLWERECLWRIRLKKKAASAVSSALIY